MKEEEDKFYRAVRNMMRDLGKAAGELREKRYRELLSGYTDGEPQRLK